MFFSRSLRYMMKSVILLLSLFAFRRCLCQSDFPEDFKFGVATSAYQIEGAWEEDDKGENIWDFITHNNPSFVLNSANGNVACDAYHKTEEDVQLIKDLGVHFYRFSLSWSRILPTGHVYQVNQKGIDYYSDLIDQLIAKNVTPYVTIFHWDLPQPLMEIGGWPNPRLSDVYADYADLVFSKFGDRVKNWITFNEPFQICERGFSSGTLAPGYTQEGIGGYLCGRTVLLAHAKAYKIYNEQYRETQQGRVGIAVHGAWAEPDSDSEADANAAEFWMQMNIGWFLHPIFSLTGDYPGDMKTRIEELSAEGNFTKSRLPSFSTAEVQLIRNSSDFLGLNHYGSYLCRPLGDDYGTVPSHTSDAGAECYLSDDWDETAAPWYRVTPWGFRNLLNWIKDEYRNPEVIVTENGFTDSTGELEDCDRINYYYSYLESLLEAIHDDECHVTGYTAWSLMDNFEWQYGYTQKFGLYHVDFQNNNRPRTAKMSSYIYKNIIENRRIDRGYIPEGFETCGVTAIMCNLYKIISLLVCFYVYNQHF